MSASAHPCHMSYHAVTVPSCWVALSMLPLPLKCMAAPRTLKGEGPNVVIVSAGLWHMLHVPDPQDFVDQQAAFSHGAAMFAAREPVSQP